MEMQAEPDGRTNILDAWALWRRIGIGELGEVFEACLQKNIQLNKVLLYLHLLSSPPR